MRPELEETTVAYATRLREKAHDCNFGSNYDERILEQLIQTIENSALAELHIKVVEFARIFYGGSTD